MGLVFLLNELPQAKWPLAKLFKSLFRSFAKGRTTFQIWNISDIAFVLFTIKNVDIDSLS